MAPKKISASNGTTCRVSYFTVKNLSSPEDNPKCRKVYMAQVPIRDVVAFPTDANVRDYLLEAEGRQRKRPTQVHKAIRDTIENNPGDFSILNSGIVVVARDCNINEKEKILVLRDPSIINGSQTQGVIKDFLSEVKDEEGDNRSEIAYVKLEIIVTDDEELVAETSIARNFQNDVMTISIAGRLGQLDELEKSLSQKMNGAKLQKSETKLSEDYVKTEKLLQLIAALIPEELWHPGRKFNKVYTYSMKTKCLREFQHIYESAKEPSADDHEHNSKLYRFYLDVPAQALKLYEKWKTHSGFEGTRIRAIEREGRRIVNIPDGIIFPIIAAHSTFAKRTKEGWKIVPPNIFDENELIKAAVSAYMEIANHNPWIMGKNAACYTALHQITSIYSKFGNQE